MGGTVKGGGRGEDRWCVLSQCDGGTVPFASNLPPAARSISPEPHRCVPRPRMLPLHLVRPHPSGLLPLLCIFN